MIFLVGLFSVSSLVLGGLIGAYWIINRKLLGIIMGFGAGALISAVAYDLVLEAVELGRGSFFPIFGLFAGAAVFLISDSLIEFFGHRVRAGSPNQDSASLSASVKLLVPMVLAIILDGIPESIVLGLGMFKNGSVSTSILLAVFVSNLPEALAGTSGMKASGWSTRKILTLWLSIAFICALATLLGYHVFSQVSVKWISFIQAFAGGAILMMLANSMMPESFEHGGKWAGVMTVLGFVCSAAFALTSA